MRRANRRSVRSRKAGKPDSEKDFQGFRARTQRGHRFARRERAVCVYHIHHKLEGGPERDLAIDRMIITDMPDGSVRLRIDGPDAARPSRYRPRRRIGGSEMTLIRPF